MIDFVRYTMEDYVVSDFAIQVCEALDQFYEDAMAGRRPVLILGAPPQHGKSEIVSRRLPAYLLGRNPNLSIGGLSYGKDLATDMNRDVQRIMMDEPYSRLFPESTLNPKRVVTIDVEAKRNSEMFEVAGHRGRYIAQGVGGPLTGKRIDIGLIDDPIKNAKEAMSPTTKDSIWNWYISTFLTRLSKNSGQIIMATRWALDDLSGRIIEKNPHAKVLNFPAINEAGEALVPELHPVEKLLETKATMTAHFWSAMYQQSPTVQGGSLFPVDRFGILDHPPLPSEIISSVRSWDKAGTQGGGDWTAGTLIHRMKDGRYVVADVVRGQWSALDRERKIRQTAEVDGRKVKIMVEQEPGSGGKESAEATIRNLSGFKVQSDRVTGSKEVRAEPYAAQVQGGNVYLVRAPWNRQFIEEHEVFPNGGHDDVVDSASGAFNKLAGVGASLKSWV